MNADDLRALNDTCRGATLDVFDSHGGKRLATVPLAEPFEPAGESARTSLRAAAVMLDGTATWCELRDPQGALLQEGPLSVLNPLEAAEKQLRDAIEAILRECDLIAEPRASGASERAPTGVEVVSPTAVGTNSDEAP